MKVIFISGPTGSGKTTLSKKISKQFKNSFILSTDNYYYTGLLSKLLSLFLKNYFDKLISFNYKLFKKDFKFIYKNFKATHKYLYDFQNKSIRKISIKKNNIKILIIEGIFAKDFLEKVFNNDFLLIEIKSDKLSCLNRVIKRDINKRGKSMKKAKIDFLESWNYYYYKNSKINLKNFIYSNNKDIISLFEKIINLNP